MNTQQCIIKSPQGQSPAEYIRQEVERMDPDIMTQAELVIFLETLAENVEIKARTPKDAAEIIRAKAEALKPQQNPGK